MTTTTTSRPLTPPVPDHPHPWPASWSVLRHSHGFSTGLLQALFVQQQQQRQSENIWILDNSGSMVLGDGYRIVETCDGKTVEQSVSRWEELQHLVVWQAELAAALALPTYFCLLNYPGDRIGVQTFSVATKTTNGRPPLPLQSPPRVGGGNHSSNGTTTTARRSSQTGTTNVPKYHHGQWSTTTTTTAHSSGIRPAHATVTSRGGTGVPSTTTTPTGNATAEELRLARNILQRTKPAGVSPLTQHIQWVERALRSSRGNNSPTTTTTTTTRNITLILATDGLPTDTAGNEGPAVQQEFIQALQRLHDLPISLILIRLCSNKDAKVAQFYQGLAAVVSVPLVVVLKDHGSQAIKVGKYNPWLNYAAPLHQCREMGLTHPLFQVLEQRPLTAREIRDFSILLFGPQAQMGGGSLSSSSSSLRKDDTTGSETTMDTVLLDADDALSSSSSSPSSLSSDWPNPETHWTDFVDCVQQHVARHSFHWDPRKRVLAPWIHVKHLVPPPKSLVTNHHRFALGAVVKSAARGGGSSGGSVGPATTATKRGNIVGSNKNHYNRLSAAASSATDKDKEEGEENPKNNPSLIHNPPTNGTTTTTTTTVATTTNTTTTTTNTKTSSKVGPLLAVTNPAAHCHRHAVAAAALAATRYTWGGFWTRPSRVVANEGAATAQVSQR
ncbi:hypothetical protein ACA910_002171 [Epithemia clementina (nom. ined.)]